MQRLPPRPRIGIPQRLFEQWSEDFALGVHHDVDGRPADGSARIVEQAAPEVFFSAPRYDRTRLFLSQIL